ncbi:hypothetical protein BB561_004871 [Smittium simulii]|uniref:Uncharacterized protein n=1 Tax=Smittium simulii TaxID=133385 RepID=A0A2T9YDN8_9FUNG|nr:hypothetical protein BB561_004871 [Smittium simulii]
MSIGGVSNSSGSHYNGLKVGRMIEHILYRQSNHCLNYCTLSHPQKPSKITSKQVEMHGNTLINNNKFAVLADSTNDLDTLCVNTIDIIKKTFSQSSDQKNITEKLPNILSSSTLKMTRKQQIMFIKMRKNNNIISEYINNYSKQFWSFIKNKCDKSTYQVVDGPISDINNNIITSLDAKLNVWAKHFGDLADDTTGNSRNNTKSDYIFSNKTMPYYEGNNIITWKKVTIVLEATQNSKAAGIDTIPSEIW